MTVTTDFIRSRRRVTPLRLVVVLISCGCLVVSGTGILAGSVSNDGASATGAALAMRETSGGASCTSGDVGTVSVGAASCALIKELGGDLEILPGRTVTTPIVITNVGTIDAGGIELTPEGGCTQRSIGAWSAGSATDLCSRILVTIMSGSRTVFRGSALKLGQSTSTDFSMPKAPAAGHAVEFVFTATLDPKASDAYENIEAELPLRWSLTS